jgi:mutator protein MutT
MRLRGAAGIVLVGIAAGLTGIALTWLLHAVQYPLYGYRHGTFLVGVRAAAPWRRLVVLAGGGLVLGVVWWRHRRYADGDALSVSRALRDPGVRLPLGHTLLDAAIQVAAVGVGASVGREGAPRQGGAALADRIARRLGLDDARRRTLLACGAGAGLAAMYDVPLAGAAFTLEVLLVSRRWAEVVPAVATSVIAAALTWPVLGTAPSYTLPAGGLHLAVLVAAVPFGIAAGLLGEPFVRLMRLARTHAPTGWTLVPTMTVGFAVLGALAMWRPELLGNGKGLGQVAFDGTAGLGTLVLLGLLKPLLTALCLRAGAIGGLLTPGLATGAALGAAGGVAWHGLWPDAPVASYALIGAGAFLAVTQRAAVTSVLLIVELARPAAGEVPSIVLAVAVAVLTARAVAGLPVRDTRPMNEPAPRRTVVAAALLSADGGSVLAARRTAPPAMAGRWELPGGKVEPGETPEAALVREIGEELGCVIEVGEWLDGESPIGETHVLRVAMAIVTAGEPRPYEHDALRWVAADELDGIDWLEPDRPFLTQLHLILAGPTRLARAVFFEEDDARTVVDTLLADGWSALLVRERFHGEDDEEDQPWAVETDAPAVMLDLLLDEYDGWLDEGEAAPDGSRAPEPLPAAPRRIKRPLAGQ